VTVDVSAAPIGAHHRTLLRFSLTYNTSIPVYLGTFSNQVDLLARFSRRQLFFVATMSIPLGNPTVHSSQMPPGIYDVSINNLSSSDDLFLRQSHSGIEYNPPTEL
jgi:hypothetical protein